MFGSKLNDEVNVNIAGSELSGISSVDFSYSNTANILKPLGSKKGLTTVGGGTQQKVSISRHLIYDDPVLNYTGSNNALGNIRYDYKTYNFSSGYLTNYSVNCAVGSVPKVNATFVVLDELTSSGISSNESSEAGNPIDNIYIPSQGSISITCDNSTTNRVIGFDYSITANRKPHFSIGQESAVDIELIPPLEYTVQVQIEVDSAQPEDSYNFLATRENKTLSFGINGRNGESIQALTVPNATLISESLSASDNGSVVLNLNYIGHGF
jgi:hypothetical protein